MQPVDISTLALSDRARATFAWSDGGGYDQTMEAEPVTITIDRDHLFIDTLRAFLSCTPEQLQLGVRVAFVGEEGQDEGGLTRELLHLFGEVRLAESTTISHLV